MNIINLLQEHTLPILIRRVLNQLEIRQDEAEDYVIAVNDDQVYKVGLYIRKLEEK